MRGGGGGWWRRRRRQITNWKSSVGGAPPTWAEAPRFPCSCAQKQHAVGSVVLAVGVGVLGRGTGGGGGEGTGQGRLWVAAG